MAKWVYMFTEGNADMRNLLGGKGANLAEMTNLGLPVPQERRGCLNSVTGFRQPTLGLGLLQKIHSDVL